MEGFGEIFGRDYYLIDDYRLDDADIVLISMGSLLGTMKDAVDEMREEGTKVGILKITSYRPFPKEKIYGKLKGIDKGIVFEKDVSIGMGAGLLNDLKAALYGKKQTPSLYGFAVGLGGRDVTINDIKESVRMVKTLELEDFASELEDFGCITYRMFRGYNDPLSSISMERPMDSLFIRKCCCGGVRGRKSIESA
jgi:pyruvate ferredoxin oxidoreductase alpha subunit